MQKNTIQPNGHKIRRLRLENEMTQSDLAQIAVLGKRTIENVEASKPTYPSTLRDIAKALNVDYKELLAPDEQEMVRGIDALKSLMEAIREEIRWVLGNYASELNRSIDEGQPVAQTKQRLIELSRTRIDQRAKCSQVSRDVKLGLRHHSPQEWDVFFRETQKLFAEFQEVVHSHAILKDSADLDRWELYQNKILGRVKDELNECINQLM